MQDTHQLQYKSKRQAQTLDFYIKTNHIHHHSAVHIIYTPLFTNTGLLRHGHDVCEEKKKMIKWGDSALAPLAGAAGSGAAVCVTVTMIDVDVDVDVDGGPAPSSVARHQDRHRHWPHQTSPHLYFLTLPLDQ